MLLTRATDLGLLEQRIFTGLPRQRLTAAPSSQLSIWHLNSSQFAQSQQQDFLLHFGGWESSLLGGRCGWDRPGGLVGRLIASTCSVSTPRFLCWRERFAPPNLSSAFWGDLSDRGMRHSRILQGSSNKRFEKMSQFAPMI